MPLDDDFEKLANDLYGKNTTIDAKDALRLFLRKYLNDGKRYLEEKKRATEMRKGDMKRSVRWLMMSLGNIASGTGSVVWTVSVSYAVNNWYVSSFVIGGGLAWIGYWIYNIRGLKRDYYRFKEESKILSSEYEGLVKEYGLLERLYNELK